MREMNAQEPGSDEFQQIKYSLRIYDTNDRDGPLRYYQAASPFPSFHSGDKMKTIAWQLQQNGHSAIINEVYHNVFSIGDQVYCETSLYCRFYDEREV